jgi:leucyl-tRNA synthetase
VDHPISKLYENNREFSDFKNKCSKIGTTEEAMAQAEKIGFKTSLIASNPLDPNIEIPIYFANFVLMDYGSGAILVALLTIREILILQTSIISK